ncbi:MAG TPA: Fe-S cluster assembly protein IscX [Acidimicrobiales bacterium]|nr:Fe-S cluster assembly protein IscX [Acidimicrobiales bacterium]
MGWDDITEICDALADAHPELDPRDLTAAEITAAVTSLPGFEGDPHGANAGHFEAIRAGVWWG